ncbi:Meiotic Sister-Chromatid recombination aldehyde dehydrogenase [Hanseniaspora vineae]
MERNPHSVHLHDLRTSNTHLFKNQPMYVSVIATILVVLVTSKFLLSQKKSKIPKPIKFEYPIPDEAKPHWKGKRIQKASCFQDNDAANIYSYCPATGAYLGKFPSMTTEDLDKTILKSKKAQLKWKNTTFEQRKQVLVTLYEYILENQESIAKVCSLDSGKTLVDGSMGEILVSLEKINWILKHGEDILTKVDKRPGPTHFFLKFYKGAKVVYEPLGLVGAIVSWNYPFHNLLGPIVASIFTGNSVIVKCSEQVIYSSEYFTGIIKKVLEVCGHDPELVNLFYCFPPNLESESLLTSNTKKHTADYFSANPNFKHLTFIGSKPVAQHVLKQAAEPITPCVVELGGKDCFIVLDSVKDLQSLSSIIMRGTFQSAGQNCIGIERIVVAESKYDELVDILNKRVGGLRLGSDIDDLVENVDMGAMISDNRFQQLEDMVQDAVSKGARLLHGGSRYQHPKYTMGHYFQPTLLVDVTPDMDIAQNEVFGPIMTIMKAKDNLDSIVEIANSAEFGLGGSVFGANYDDCVYVAERLTTGNVAINDFATFYVCQLPFGGCNGSGYAKFGGEEGLLGLCNAKSICYDTLPFVSTQIPPQIDYPIKDNKKAWEFVKALNTASYTMSPWTRVKEIFKLAKS